MIALSRVAAARIGAEVLRLIQIVPPAADIGEGDVRIPLHEQGRGALFYVGEVQAHLVVAAVPLDLADGAQFRLPVARQRKGIMEPRLPREQFL